MLYIIVHPSSLPYITLGWGTTAASSRAGCSTKRRNSNGNCAWKLSSGFIGFIDSTWLTRLATGDTMR